LHVESSEPISLRRYKELWKDAMGLNYIDDYELRYQEQVLSDDDQIIDNSAFKEPYYDV
jgi:hypothetical protein